MHLVSHNHSIYLRLCREQYNMLKLTKPFVLFHQKKTHEAHDGTFGAHLRDARVHSQLSKHYWWKAMRADIIQWCRACPTCVTCRAGGAVKPPLKPISVSRPFHHVGVDVVHFPKSEVGQLLGIQYHCLPLAD